MERKKFRAAIFDLDGTLLDTLEDIARSMNRTLAKYGLPTHPIDKYRFFVGDGARILVQRTLPESHAQDQGFVSKCLEDFLTDYGANWDRNAKLYPGIATMLDGLTIAGIKMGVLSNKPHAFTKLCVERFMGRWHFQAVFGERPGTKRKPSPEGALEIADIMAIGPENFVYLGDTSIDMKTAIGAGMFPVGVLWGFRDERELREAGAKLLIRKPIELLNFLE